MIHSEYIMYYKNVSHKTAKLPTKYVYERLVIGHSLEIGSGDLTFKTFLDTQRKRTMGNVVLRTLGLKKCHMLSS